MVKRNKKGQFAKGHNSYANRKFQKGDHPKTEFKKGHKMSKSVRKKISKTLSGKNSYMWKGGITPKSMKIRHSIEFRLWRESVFARDNYTCQKYGTKEESLHAHHIKNFAKFPELRFAIDNGITFSKKAHSEFHKIYGYKNNTREQLEEFLNQ